MRRFARFSILGIVLLLFVLFVSHGRRPVLHLIPGVQQQLDKLNSNSDRSFDLKNTVDQLRAIPDWNRVVIFSPYQQAAGFTEAGLSDQALIDELTDISGAEECWHIAVINADDQIVARTCTSAPKERTSSPIVLIRR